MYDSEEDSDDYGEDLDDRDGDYFLGREDKITCSQCGRGTPGGEDNCQHCGAEFSDDDDDKCSLCGLDELNEERQELCRMRHAAECDVPDEIAVCSKCWNQTCPSCGVLHLRCDHCLCVSNEWPRLVCVSCAPQLGASQNLDDDSEPQEFGPCVFCGSSYCVDCTANTVPIPSDWIAEGNVLPLRPIRQHSRNEYQKLELPNELAELVHELKRLRVAARDAQDAAEEIRLDLLKHLGTRNLIGTANGTRVISLSLGSRNYFEKAKFEEDFPDLFREYTSQRETFVIKTF